DVTVAQRPDAVCANVSVLTTGRDFMGENPVWCPQAQRLWWLDILAPALRWLDVATGETHRVLLPDLTGGLALTASGRLLLAGRHGLTLFDPQTKVHTLLFDPEKHKPDNRFNSASLDPFGNLWIGTMPVDGVSGTGSLYRIGPDLSVAVVLDEIGMPKNPIATLDGSRLYVSDGRTGVLYAHDIADGALGPGGPIVAGSADTGTPNGIALDEEGCLWVAMLGGWRVNRYDPDGALMRSIALPVPMPTALAFGGPQMETLYVTSTYLRMPPGYSTLAPQAGN
ncbi:MAG: SMP-30/gluconolactonase/LRE family protein, partial [Pseudomonadota bacterium]